MRISDWSSDVCSSDLLSVKSKIFGVCAWATPTFMNLAGDAANGLLAGVAYAPTISGDLNKTFVSKFKAAYNEDPGKYSMSGYNTIHIIADAIKRAGAAEPAKIREALIATDRSEEHTSELQSLMRISYAVFCLKKKKYDKTKHI